MRTILRAQQLSTWKVVDTTRIEWDAGAQVVNNFAVGSYTDIQGMFSAIGASATGQDTTRMVVKSAKHKLSFTNQSNANACVTLYDIEFKRDTYIGSDFVTPLTAWSTGVARTEESGDSPSELNVGTTPYQSSDFCRTYRVTKVTKIYLDPGKSHMHYISIAANKLLNNGMTDSSQQQAYWRGFSHACLMVCQGLPVNDATTDTLIAMGSGAIDVVEERTYEQCYPQYGLKRYYFDNNQGTITSEKIINDEINAPATYAET